MSIILSEGIKQMQKFERLNNELSLRSRKKRSVRFFNKKNQKIKDRKLRTNTEKKKESAILRKAKQKSDRDKYIHYISKSSQWKRLREEIIDDRGCICERCKLPNSAKNLHVHHMTYIRLFNELKSDLALLCVECHEYVHSISRKNNPYFI